MFQSTQEFLQFWASEARNTSKILSLIPDDVLEKKLIPHSKTIGELSWKILQIPKELLEKTGLKIDGPSLGSHPPKTTKEIISEHGKMAESVLRQVSKWKDEELKNTDKIHGENWRKTDTLLAILLMTIHYRGELITLMRAAGIDVKSIYEIG